MGKETFSIAMHSTYAMEGPSGGVQKHVQELSNYLVSQGNSVAIVTPRFEGREGKSGYVYMGNATEHSHSGTTLYVDRGPFPLSEVTRVLREHPVDISHYHDPPNSSKEMLHLWASKAHNFVTFHAQNKPNWKYDLFAPLRPAYGKIIASRIAVSKPAYDFANRYFSGEYEIIPNGINVSEYTRPVEPIERFKDGKLNVLFVSRLEPRKGVGELISAYANVKNRNSNVRLIVVGEGQLRETCEERVKSEGIQDVHFVGKVDEEDLVRYYKTADVFCAPAPYGESFGRVLVEAMAAKVPVFCANNAGFTSWVKDGLDALVFDPKNEIEFAYLLDLILSNPDLRTRLKKNGSKKAEYYDWSQIGPKVLDLYKRKIAS